MSNDSLLTEAPEYEKRIKWNDFNTLKQSKA